MIAYALLMALAAGPAAAAVTPENQAKARDLYQAGQQLYKQGKLAEAAAKFEQARAIRPHPTISFNLGKCYEQLGETGSALRAYRDYLRQDPTAKDKKAVDDTIANLERRLRDRGQQQLLVFTEPPEALVTVDGKVVGYSPASVELTAGEHRLQVKADGYDPVDRTFTFSIARASELTVKLETGTAPPPPPPPPLVSDAPKVTTVSDPGTSRGSTTTITQAPAPTTNLLTRPRLWTWVAGGVAVAGLGAGVGLGAAAYGTAKQVGTSPNGAQATSLAQSAQGQALGANISYGVAGAAAVTAVILFFLEGQPQPAQR